MRPVYYGIYNQKTIRSTMLFWRIRSRCEVITRRRRILLSGPSETTVQQNENSSVDFVYERFKANKHRHSIALVKGFPTPPSSCPTDTGLLSTVYLSTGTQRAALCTSLRTHECVRAHTHVFHRAKQFVGRPLASP